MEVAPTPPGPRSAVVFRLWQALHRGCRLARSNARSGRMRTGTTWSTCVASSVRPAAAHARQSGSSRRTCARSAFHRAEDTTASSTPRSGSQRRARLYSASAERRRWRIPASERGFDGMTPRHAPAGLSATEGYHARGPKQPLTLASGLSNLRPGPNLAKDRQEIRLHDDPVLRAVRKRIALADARLPAHLRPSSPDARALLQDAGKRLSAGAPMLRLALNDLTPFPAQRVILLQNLTNPACGIRFHHNGTDAARESLNRKPPNLIIMTRLRPSTGAQPRRKQKHTGR